MKHETRIANALAANGIKRILLIDDAYDTPSLGTEVPGALLDYLEREDGFVACVDAGAPDALVRAATSAAQAGEPDAEPLIQVMRVLYAKFVETRGNRFDPGGLFTNGRGATLDVLAPLLALLKRCKGVDVRVAGLADSELVYLEHSPQVVLLDYFLSSDVTAAGEGAALSKARARKESIDLLMRLLKATKGDDPAVILMSSADLQSAVAETFRLAVDPGGSRVLALRFRFLRKGWITQGAGEINILHEAADVLLDTSQGFVFGQVLQRALLQWRQGAESALKAFLKEIGGLEPKDFAYLYRFRLLTEGERMSDYLEWMFGESLRALIDEQVDWKHASFGQLDDPTLSEGIEGAFDGPSVRIAQIFHRIRIDEHKGRSHRRNALGDIYVSNSSQAVRTVLTPDCDLVVRKGRTKARQILTMGGELRSFDNASASADQFIFLKGRPYSLKWDAKDLRTMAVQGPGALSEDPDFTIVGTLRPIYAQEMQRHALTDLSRVGLAVAPAMGVDASASVWLRVKNGGGTVFVPLTIPANNTVTLLLERAEASSGHMVLLRRSFVHALIDALREVDAGRMTDDDAARHTEFVNDKNHGKLISGFLSAGSFTRDKGPLGTTVALSGKPDTKQGSPWLQFLLELSREAMQELLTVDPLLAQEAEAPVAGVSPLGVSGTAAKEVSTEVQAKFSGEVAESETHAEATDVNED